MTHLDWIAFLDFNIRQSKKPKKKSWKAKAFQLIKSKETSELSVYF